MGPQLRPVQVQDAGPATQVTRRSEPIRGPCAASLRQAVSGSGTAELGAFDQPPLSQHLLTPTVQDPDGKGQALWTQLPEQPSFSWPSQPEDYSSTFWTAVDGDEKLLGSDAFDQSNLGPMLDWNDVLNDEFATQGQKGAQRLPGDDDDAASCDSACVASCASQCGEPGHGVCCDDDSCQAPELCLDEACKEASWPCTDRNCSVTSTTPQDSLERVVTDGDKAAAKALASFGDGQLPPAPPPPPQDSADAVGCYPPVDSLMAYSGSCLGASLWPTIACANLSTEYFFPAQNNLPPQSLQYQPELRLASHIMQYHLSESQPQHPPCIADNPSQLIPRCSLPAYAPDGPFSDQTATQPCGFPVQSPTAFAQHIYEQHGAFLPERAPQLHSPPAPNAHHSNLCHSVADGGPSKLFGTVASQPPPSNSSTNLSPAEAFGERAMSLTTPSSEFSLYADENKHLHIFADENSHLHHGEPAKEAPQAKAAFKCMWRTGIDDQVCGKIFSDEEHLNAHCDSYHVQPLDKHSAGFWCAWQDCPRDAPFPQKNKLERHLRSHTGYKPFRCPECSERFSAKQALIQHVNMHKGEKPWRCTFPGCPSSFAQQSALKMHVRTHTGEKPLVCEVCGKRFGESSNLSKHRRIHDEKPMYECEICSKGFNRIDQLKRHHAKKHPDAEQAEEIMERARNNAKQIQALNRSKKIKRRQTIAD